MHKFAGEPEKLLLGKNLLIVHTRLPSVLTVTDSPAHVRFSSLIKTFLLCLPQKSKSLGKT